MRSVLILLFIPLCLLGTCGTAASSEMHWTKDITLVSPSGLESNACYFDIGDIDGDGKPDLIVLEDGPELWFYRNIGEGGAVRFERRTDWEFPAEGSIYRYRCPFLADLNGDGRCELIVDFLSYPTGVYCNAVSGKSLGWQRADSLLSGLIETTDVYGFGDIDNDGDIDLYGSARGKGTGFFRNVGSKTKPAWNPTLLPVHWENPNTYYGGLIAERLSDLDGDGRIDALISIEIPICGGTLLFYKNVSTADSIQFNFQCNLYSFNCSPSTVATGDLNGDGDPELILGETPRLKLFQRTSSAPVIMEVNEIGPPQGFLETGLCASDLDSDGDEDLMMIHTDRWSDYWSGRLEFQIFQNNGGQNGYQRAFSEVLGGEYNLYQPTIHAIKLIDQEFNDSFTVGAKGVEEHILPVNGGGIHIDGVSLFDIVRVDSAWWEQYDTPYMRFQNDSIYQDPMMVDVNNDGFVELLMKRNGRYRFFDTIYDTSVWNEERNEWEYVHSGREIAAWSEGIRDTSFYRADAADMNGDGRFELVFSRNDGTLTCFQNLGTDTLPVWQEEPKTFEDIHSKTRVTPCLADMDNDGDLDLLLTDAKGTLLCYRQDSIHVSSAVSKSVQPRTVTLLQNYPNPFNSSTVILYDLPADAKVRIGVYDVRGRKVIELENGMRPAGRNRVSWDGTDESGVFQGSGVYIARMESRFGALHRKLLLVK